MVSYQTRVLRALSLFVLLFSGCATNQGPGVVSSDVPLCSPGSPALYTAQDQDTTLHLFGTVHLLKPETQWRNPSFTKAWTAADTVMFEADVDSTEAQSAVAALVRQHGVLAQGDSLFGYLNEDQSTQMQDFAESLGAPRQAFAPLKPWMASIQISMQHLIRSGYAPGAGVESVLATQAKSDGKALVYLESLEDQVLAMSSLPMPDQLAMLNATLVGLQDDPDGLDRLVDNWSQGNQQALAEEFVDIDALGSQEVYEALMVRRNQNWVPPIQALMNEPGVKFVAVGAGHMVGEDSVLAMLAGQGIVLSCE